jgi:hypothetical protein
VDGNIFNSKGVHVAVVAGTTIFSLNGRKLYDLRGLNIYKLNGDLVGHLLDAKRRREASGQSHGPTISDLLICQALTGGFRLRLDYCYNLALSGGAP